MNHELHEALDQRTRPTMTAHPELHAALDLVRDGDQLLVCRTVGKRTSRVSGPALAGEYLVSIDTMADRLHIVRYSDARVAGPITYLSVRRGGHIVAVWQAANTTAPEGADE